METARETQRAAIITALTAELQRQANTGAQRIDVEALAEAALGALEPMPALTEGRRPEDLNSSNDG
jgi:hypothetical protein